MIYIENPFMVPIVILICSVDAFLWLTVIRFTLKHITADNSFYNAVKQITDFPFEQVKQLFKKYLNKTLPDWACWLITIAGLILLRQLLMNILM